MKRWPTALSHCCRLSYLSVGLIVGITSVLCLTCDPDFTDISSRTYRADLVLDAVAHRVPDGRRGSREVVVRFRTKEVLKGQLDRDPESDKYPIISVGMFSRRSNMERCVAPLPQQDSRYILFLRSRVSPQSPGNSRNSSSSDDAAVDSSVFLISSFPVEFSEEMLAKVRDSSRSKYGKKPRLKMKTGENVTLQAGTTLRLQCVVSGRPKPKVYWYNNSTQLQKTKRVQFQDTKRGSTLLIRNLTSSDSGVYRCQAVNVVGRTSLKSTNGIAVKVTDSRSISHGVECERQDYCLNGGTCLVLVELQNLIICRCPHGTNGKRCEEKETGIPNVVFGKDYRKKF